MSQQPERQRIIDSIADALRVYTEEREWAKMRVEEMAEIALSVMEAPKSSHTEMVNPCTCGQNGYPPNSRYSNHPHLQGCAHFDANDLLIEPLHTHQVVSVGQHAGVSSGVRVSHIPSGIIVECEEHSSQLQNKELALQILAEKVRQEYEPLSPI